LIALDRDRRSRDRRDTRGDRGHHDREAADKKEDKSQDEDEHRRRENKSSPLWLRSRSRQGRHGGHRNPEKSRSREGGTGSGNWANSAPASASGGDRLWCPECHKQMKTSSFSLSQHLWQCHPESEEAKRRSRDYNKLVHEKKMGAAKRYTDEQVPIFSIPHQTWLEHSESSISSMIFPAINADFPVFPMVFLWFSYGFPRISSHVPRIGVVRVPWRLWVMLIHPKLWSSLWI